MKGVNWESYRYSHGRHCVEQRESGAQSTGKTGGAEHRGECPQPGKATEPESEV